MEKVESENSSTPKIKKHKIEPFKDIRLLETRNRNRSLKTLRIIEEKNNFIKRIPFNNHNKITSVKDKVYKQNDIINHFIVGVVYLSIICPAY